MPNPRFALWLRSGESEQTLFQRAFLLWSAHAILSPMRLPAPRSLSHRHISIEGRGSPTNPLLLLHGSGGCERDLLPLAAEIAAHSPAIAIRGAEPWDDGFAFFRRFEDRSIDEENLATNALSLAGFIEAACAHYRFSKRPIAVGFSNGAIMAAALLAMQHGLLAGAILFRPLSPFAIVHPWPHGHVRGGSLS